MSESPAPTPLSQGRANAVSAGITSQKLNGQVYTPLDLATAVVAQVPWTEGVLLDPTCGDGVFLEAAVRRLVAQGEPERIPEVHGYDIDPSAVSAARARLEAVCSELGVTERPHLAHRDALDGLPTVSTIVGNPPYLESKRMPAELKQRIKRELPEAGTGAFDLYGALTALALRSLSDTGVLAFVIPNRVAVTAACRRLRDALLSRGPVSVVDLSTERVFADAAVYPVVLWSRPGAPSYSVETVDGEPQLTLPPETIARLDGRWPLPSPAMLPLLRRVLADPERYPPLCDTVTIRWTVSFHRSGLRDRYVFDTRPSSPHAKPFLGGMRFSGNRELSPFATEHAGAWIDYDEARARADKNPLPPAELFTPPLVAIPQNARRPRAALITEPIVLKDTFLAARADELTLKWLVVVLNSALFHHLYEALYGGTRKGGGYLHLLGSYLNPVPLPPAPAGIDALHDARAASPDDPALIEACERAVTEAYGVNAHEARVLDDLHTPSA